MLSTFLYEFFSHSMNSDVEFNINSEWTWKWKWKCKKIELWAHDEMINKDAIENGHIDFYSKVLFFLFSELIWHRNLCSNVKEKSQHVALSCRRFELKPDNYFLKSMNRDSFQILSFLTPTHSHSANYNVENGSECLTPFATFTQSDFDNSPFTFETVNSF